MDIFSNALLSLTISDMQITSFHFTAPWGIETVGSEPACSVVVLEGGCWFAPKGEKRVELLKGDSIINLRGYKFELSSSKTGSLVPVSQVLNQTEFPGFDYFPPGVHLEANWGGGGQATKVLCLPFRFENDMWNRLIGALPDFMLIREKQSRAYPSIQSSIDFITAEKSQNLPGEYAVKIRLAELTLVSQLRAYIAEQTESKGLLAGVKNKKINSVLSALHKHPEANWQVKQMADIAGMSRSAFALKFKVLLETSPMEYVHSLRINKACQYLKQGSLSITEIAHRVGYESDRHFRRTFQRFMEMAPGVYRKSLNCTD
jgi:AraC-like DNA-binding protein